MKRGLILLLSMCLCMTQAIGLLHGIAHGITGYGPQANDGLTHSSSGHKHSHDVGRGNQPTLGESKPSALGKIKPSALEIGRAHV